MHEKLPVSSPVLRYYRHRHLVHVPAHRFHFWMQTNLVLHRIHPVIGRLLCVHLWRGLCLDQQYHLPHFVLHFQHSVGSIAVSAPNHDSRGRCATVRALLPTSVWTPCRRVHADIVHLRYNQRVHATTHACVRGTAQLAATCARRAPHRHSPGTFPRTATSAKNSPKGQCGQTRHHLLHRRLF